MDEQYNYIVTTMLEISNLGPCNTFCIMDLCVVTESSE